MLRRCALQTYILLTYLLTYLLSHIIIIIIIIISIIIIIILFAQEKNQACCKNGDSETI